MFRSTALDTLISSRVLEGSLPLKHEKEGSELGGTPGMTVDQFTGPEGRGVSRDSGDPRKSRHCCLGPSFPLSICQVCPTLFQCLCFVLHYTS